MASMTFYLSASVASVTYTYNGTSTTITDIGSHSVTGLTAGTDVYVSVSLKSGYTNAHVTCTLNGNSDGSWYIANDPYIRVKDGRYCIFAGEQSGSTKTFYYKYRYLNSSDSTISNSDTYSKSATSSTTSISITLSSIPTITGYSKTGSYKAVQACSLGNGVAYCSGTTYNTPSIIGVYVEPIYHEYWYKYRYTDSSYNLIKESSVMVATVAGNQYDQTLSDIPEPNTGRWIKSDTYWGGNACSINASSGYARCTSTAQNNPSVIGVYCTQRTIDRFTWTGTDSGDTSAFQSGENISTALTAKRWNDFLAKIKEVAEANGGSFSYTNVGQERIKANATNNKNNGFNDAVNAISNITGHGTLPSTQSPGDTIYASLYVGNGSLKTALNAAINIYNNS